MADEQEPLCPLLSDPVAPADEEAFVVPHVITAEEATAAVRRSILTGWLRPSDIGDAVIEPTRLAYMPYWRIHASVDGFHIRLSHGQGPDGRIKWVLPTGGRRHREAVVLIEARRLVPFLPKLLPMSDARTKLWGQLSIERDTMEPRARHPELEGEEIQLDVPRDAAEHQAVRALLRTVQPTSALYSDYEPTVLSTACCHYPLYVTTYGYEGRAKKQSGLRYHVTLSGRTGKILAARHPSAARALAGKLSDLFK